MLWGAIAVFTVLAVWLLLKKRVDRLPRQYGELSITLPSQQTIQHAADSLSLMVRCPTVSVPDGKGDFVAFDVMLRFLKLVYPLCFARMKLDLVNDYSIMLHWKGKNSKLEPLLFCAHLDVVPAGEGWSHDPFGGDQSGGYVHGRGTLDVKSAMVCLLESAEQLLAEGYTPENDIYFAFGHDEEIGGRHGAAAMARRFAHRGLRFAMVLDEGGFCMKHGEQYVAQVGVAEKGMMNLRLSCRDDGGHAATPPKHTALGRLAEAISRIEACQPKPRLTTLTRDYYTAVAATLPHKQRFWLANSRLFGRALIRSLATEPADNALLRTTAVPTVAQGGDTPNVLPRTAEAVVNVRLLTGDSSQHFLDYIKRLTSDLRVEINVLRAQEPSLVSRYNDRVFFQLTESIQDVLGPVTVAPYLMAGATDASKYEQLSYHTYRYCPFVLSKANHATIHAANERIQDKALGCAVLFYRSLMSKTW